MAKTSIKSKNCIKSMIEPVIIEQKIKDLENKPWTPIVLTRVNDQVVRLALFKSK
ncbi:MAG: hypothetical protein ACTSSH_13870 [Candidatus Heimdallarchaeota archaeon]